MMRHSENMGQSAHTLPGITVIFSADCTRLKSLMVLLSPAEEAGIRAVQILYATSCHVKVPGCHEVSR